MKWKVSRTTRQYCTHIIKDRECAFDPHEGAAMLFAGTQHTTLCARYTESEMKNINLGVVQHFIKAVVDRMCVRNRENDARDVSL